MRSVVLGALAAAALATSPVAAGAGPTTAADELRAITDLIATAEKMPAKTLDARLQALLAAKPFGELEPNQQCALYAMAGASKMQIDNGKAAAAYLAKATACPGADKEIWSLRLRASLMGGDDDGAAASLLQLAQHWPAEINEFRDQAVLRAIYRAHELDNGPQRRLELIDAISDSGWKPTDPAITMDGLWVILAGGLADHGHVTRAATVAQRISNPWVLASMRADRRFDGLFDHAAARFDPEAAWGAQLEMRRKLMADHPAELSYVSDYVGELIYTHHPDMALKLIDDALARAAAAPKGKPAYTDLDDKLIWIKDARAHALFELSRADEAVAMLVTASAEKENGGANVSQVINLGELYIRLGRPQDALNSVARAVTNMSPYGRMQAEGVKAWAYAHLADKENLAKSLAYVRAHESDAPGSLPDVLIGANDLDGAAAIYIRRLADPDTRLQALDELQAYAPSLHTTPVMQESDRRWRALVARPDMKAAIDKVGRVNSYSFMAAPG